MLLVSLLLTAGYRQFSFRGVKSYTKIFLLHRGWCPYPLHWSMVNNIHSDLDISDRYRYRCSNSQFSIFPISTHWRNPESSLWGETPRRAAWGSSDRYEQEARISHDGQIWPMPIHLHIVCGYFCATTAEPSEGDCMAPKILIWSSREKLANLWDQTGEIWGVVCSSS